MWCICVYVCSVTQLCLTLVTPWTIAHQAPLSMEFSMQEYWSGLPFLPLGDLRIKGLSPCLLHWQVNSLPLCHLRSPICVCMCVCVSYAQWTISHPYSKTIHILYKEYSLTIGTTWMDLEGIMLSKVSHMGKDKYHMISLICGL